jgi:hypothetical protein
MATTFCFFMQEKLNSDSAARKAAGYAGFSAPLFLRRTEAQRSP